MAEDFDQPQFTVVDQSPYTWFSNETIGRWFFDQRDGDNAGIVWTDNLNGFGFVGADVDQVAGAMDAVNEWATFRLNSGLSGLTARQAFEAALEKAGNPEVNEGPLQTVSDFVPPITVTAAAEPTPAELLTRTDGPAGLDDETTDDTDDEQLPSTNSFHFTISDDEEVLELIVSHPAGVAVRDSGDWLEIDIEEDHPTIYDQEWLEVYEPAMIFWDEESVGDRVITRDEVLKYAVDTE